MKKEVTFLRLKGALASKGISFKELASLMTERGEVNTFSTIQ